MFGVAISKIPIFIDMKQVRCINNVDAEDELTVGMVYLVEDNKEMDEFYMIGPQPFLKWRFEDVDDLEN